MVSPVEVVQCFVHALNVAGSRLAGCLGSSKSSAERSRKANRLRAWVFRSTRTGRRRSTLYPVTSTRRIPSPSQYGLDGPWFVILAWLSLADWRLLRLLMSKFSGYQAVIVHRQYDAP